MATRLAQMGYRTIFIDADGQANATYAFGLEKEPGIYNLLVRGNKPEGQWDAVLRKTATENLLVVPGDEETFNIADRVKETSFMRRLHDVKNFADFVVFDLSPSFAKIHQAAVNAADYIIIPTDPEPFGALNGVNRALQAASDSIEMKQIAGLPSAEILGVVVNKAEHTNIHKAIIKALSGKDVPLLEIVPKRMDLVYAALSRQSIFDYNPSCDAAENIQNIVNLVLEKSHA
jgi:cellulose biosynthesis protein BcsQ